MLLARHLRLKWHHEKEVAALREGNLRLAAELTERQRAETALRANEQQFRNVFEHAPVGIFHSLPGGRFLEVNPALTRMLGYASSAELVAATSDMTTQIYADPALRPRIVVDLLESAGWVHWDAVIWRCKDGRLITVDMTGRKVCNDAGAVVYLEGFIVDITQRMAAEAALRANEQQFRNVFEHAPVGIFHSLPGGRFLEVNPALTRMLGYASSAELVATASDMATQIYADPALRLRIVADLLENAGWAHWDAVVWRCKDGRLITVDMTARKVCNDAGAVVYLEGFIVDITQRLAAAAAFKESERLFRTLIENLPLIIYVCEGPDEKSLYVNPAFTRLTGFTLPDLPVAKTWWELAYPNPVYREELRIEWLRREQRSRETQTLSEPMETTITCKDGSQKHLLAGYIPLAGRKYIFASDITARKQAEAALFRALVQRTEELRQATTAALNASDEEARRIGHELHDTLCQDLIGISRQAEALALAGVETEGVSVALADRLQRLAALAVAAARQARGLSYLLAVSEPSDAPLEETLRGHVRQLEDLYGFTCELPSGEALLAFSPEQGAHIIRIIREALVNAARHARARRVWVDCLCESGQVILSISSDGNAAPDPETWKSGLGLRQMHMRAALLGADLTFRPGPQGAVVQLVLPQSRVVRANPFNSGLTPAYDPATRS